MHTSGTRELTAASSSFARVGMLRAARVNPVVLSGVQRQFQVENHHDHHHHDHHDHHHHDHHRDDHR